MLLFNRRQIRSMTGSFYWSAYPVLIDCSIVVASPVAETEKLNSIVEENLWRSVVLRHVEPEG